jgi:hypothetical protein
MRLRRIWNGPRSLLSLAGGRLPAEQAVSKPDAEAERERRLDKLNAYFCQDSEPQSAQNCGSDAGELLCGDVPRDEFSFAARLDSPILEPVEARAGNGNDHIAFRPHLRCREWMGQGLSEVEPHMVSADRVRRRRAQRHDCHEVAASGEPGNDDDNRPALDHFRNHEPVKVAKQDFPDLRIVHQRHAAVITGAI